MSLLLLFAHSASQAVGTCAVFLWLAWRFRQVLQHATKTKRTNVDAITHSSALVAWLRGVRYLWDGPSMISEAYANNCTGKPYGLNTPEALYVHFTSESHIRELADAPEESLSLHALSKDMFFPKLTMNGLEVQETMSANGNLHSRVLNKVLRSHLDQLQPSLARAVAVALGKEVQKVSKMPDNWVRLPTFSMAKSVICTANCRTFFGSRLTNNKEFFKAASEYPEDLLRTAEILRLLPFPLRPLLAPVLMRQHQASTTILSHLIPEIETRMKQKLAPETEEPKQKQVDCLQFFINATSSQKDAWSALRLVQAILGIWFASVHQPALSLVYALEHLCIYPEAADQLRDELAHHPHRDNNIDSLPLLDSFLKESARLQPSDSISVRRKALQPYMFSDGTCLNRGDVACVPLQAIFRDESLYPQSLTFDIFRFINKGEHLRLLSNASCFTDSRPTYPLWGLGKRACPGRYYASRLLKVALAHVLLNYEVSMDETAEAPSRTFSWRSAIIPKASACLKFRECSR